MNAPSRRPAASLLAVLSVACSPALGISVDFGDDPCGAVGSAALVLEEGACGASLGAVRWAGSPDETYDGVIEPGSYCVSALAFERDVTDEEAVCRVTSLAREGRRLPGDRETLELAPTCLAEPSGLSDALLAAVAGCNGACDTERCVCSLGCPLDAPGGACPAPVDVDQLVMGDEYVCGLATDRRSLTCWGEGAAASRVPEWDGFEDGVARTGLAPLSAGSEYLLIDGDSELFCVRDSDNELRCGGLARQNEREVREVFVVGRGFLCGGQAEVACSFPASGDLPELTEGDLVRQLRNFAGDFPFASRLSAGHENLCGIVAGLIHCTQPRAEQMACGAVRECPWYFERCEFSAESPLGDCTPRDIAPAEGLRSGEVVHPSWIDLDLGWDRACAVDSLRRLWCWSSSASDDPIGLAPPRPATQVVDGISRDVLVPTLVADVDAREVSVGAEHICLRDEVMGSVVCGGLEFVDGALHLRDPRDFPGSPGAGVEGVTEAVVNSFVAGPRGISCAIRPVEAAANRVECFQLPGFEGGEGMLGRRHTRDRELDRVDVDRADLAVCP